MDRGGRCDISKERSTVGEMERTGGSVGEKKVFTVEAKMRKMI